MCTVDEYDVEEAHSFAQEAIRCIETSWTCVRHTDRLLFSLGAPRQRQPSSAVNVARAPEPNRGKTMSMASAVASSESGTGGQEGCTADQY